MVKRIFLELHKYIIFNFKLRKSNYTMKKILLQKAN